MTLPRILCSFILFLGYYIRRRRKLLGSTRLGKIFVVEIFSIVIVLANKILHTLSVGKIRLASICGHNKKTSRVDELGVLVNLPKYSIKTKDS